ncbi:MAG: GlsB/YeaQ/YmgE family stress response membrane protein [Bacteroidales bacterium]|nr:GlsB/YeaQ/YmgE family stress response membrane protein [Bacteroidales bacterium]
MHYIWFLLIGIVIGLIVAGVLKDKGSGWKIDLAIGIVGAILGGWLFGVISFAAYNLIGALISALIGALLLLWVVRLIRKRINEKKGQD